MRKKTNREIGDQYEKEIAEELGGKLIQGSGSIRERKEDIDFPKMRMQVKSTSKESISITLKDLYHLEEHAMDCGKIPAYLFAVGGKKAEWIAFPLWMIEDLEWFKKLRSH